MLLGAFKLAMTFVAVSFVDTAGRRPLLLAGVSTMVAALVALGGLSVATAAAAGGVGAVDPALAWGSVAALLLYVGAYQVRVPAFALCPLGPLGLSLCGIGWWWCCCCCGVWVLVASSSALLALPGERSCGARSTCKATVDVGEEEAVGFGGKGFPFTLNHAPSLPFR